MNQIKIDKCSRCGRQGYIIPSNNPLFNGTICLDCINAAIDVSNMEHFAFFCRTYNLPVNPNLYLGCLKKDKSNAIKLYLENLYDNGDLEFKDATTDQWKEVEKEWTKVKTRRQLIEKIQPIKQDFIERGGEKWGTEYSFEQLMKLEAQYNNIISTLGMTNPTQMDNVQKYCKMSMLVDEMIAGGEMKAISDGTTALSKLADLAQIKEMSETANSGTIKTVADLYRYMEDHGFKFNYYDNVDRDVVDATIKDIQSSIRNEIVNAVGLDVTFESIKENYLRTQEENAAELAIKDTSIEDLMAIDDDVTEEEAQLDKALSEEEVIYEDEE